MIARLSIFLLVVVSCGAPLRAAWAASYDFGTIAVPSSISIFGGTIGLPQTTHVLDAYAFKVASIAELTVGAVELKFHQIVNFASITADLHDSACGGCVVASASGSHGFLLAFANLLPSSEYLLRITGTLGSYAIAGAYYGSVNVSAVPIPAAALLFGSALGVLVMLRRKMKTIC